MPGAVLGSRDREANTTDQELTSIIKFLFLRGDRQQAHNIETRIWGHHLVLCRHGNQSKGFESWGREGCFQQGAQEGPHESSVQPHNVGEENHLRQKEKANVKSWRRNKLGTERRSLWLEREAFFTEQLWQKLPEMGSEKTSGLPPTGPWAVARS